MFEEWNQIASVWNENMKDGDWFQRHIIYPEVLRFLSPVKNKKVIDVGCGNGHLSRFLAKQGAKAFGVDNSQQMITACNLNGGSATFACLDITAETMPCKKRFDAAVFNNSMQDMQEYEKGLKGAYQLLKKRGELLIVVKHPCFHGRSERCGWHVTTQSGERIVTGHGLSDLEKRKEPYTGEYFVMNDYLSKSEHTREWYGLKTTSYARTLQEYINAVIRAGFVIESLSEPKPLPSGQAENPSLYNLLTKIPNFIFIYARKK